MNFSRLAQAILAHRWRTALVLAVVFFGCFSGVHKAVVDFSATAFFAGEGEERIALDTYRDYWGSDDNIAAVLVEGGDETLLNAERLAVIRELSSALRETDAASHVTSITDVPRYRLQFGNPVPWGFLMEVPPEEGPQEAWRAQVLANSLLVPMLLSEDGKLAALVVVLPGNVDDVVAVRSIIGQLRETILGFDGREGLRITMSGVPAVRADIGDMILQEQFLFVSIAVVLMATLMMILFRRFYGVVIPLISAMAPCLMVFGIMGWVGEPIGLLNQAYFTLIPVIAIADAIHMVSRFREEFQRKIDAGEPPSVELRDGAIQAALRHIGVACFLTTLTTVVGFCSLMSAEMPVLRSFGLYAGIGVALAYFSVLFFIPLALSLTEPRLTAREKKASPIDGFLRFCGRITTQRPWACLGGSGLLVILAIWQGSNVIVNNHLTGVLPAGSPTQHANELMDEKLGGVISVRFDLFGDPGSMEDKALLEDMLVLGAKLESLEPVRVVISPASTVAYGATILGGSFAIPSPSNIRRVLRLVESNQTSMRLISPERDRAQIVVQVRDNGANAFQSMVEQIELEIEAAIGKHPIRVVTTGTPFVAYAGINRITTDLRSSLMFAFLAVTILVVLLFRSLRVGLLFLPANAVPLVLGYGFMGLMGWPLEPTTGVVFTVALGIAVDDSIHLMVRFREELDNGLSVDHALQESILRCGRAVIVTSIVLSCGFFVNTFSSFPYTQALGGLGGFVILSALFCDLIVLPPLLKLFYRSPNRLNLGVL